MTAATRPKEAVARIAVSARVVVIGSTHYTTNPIGLSENEGKTRLLSSDRLKRRDLRYSLGFARFGGGGFA